MQTPQKHVCTVHTHQQRWEKERQIERKKNEGIAATTRTSDLTMRGDSGGNTRDEERTKGELFVERKTEEE